MEEVKKNKKIFLKFLISLLLIFSGFLTIKISKCITLLEHQQVILEKQKADLEVLKKDAIGWEESTYHWMKKYHNLQKDSCLR